MRVTRRQLLKFTAGAAIAAGLPASARANGVRMGVVRLETGPAFGSAWRLVLPDTADAALARGRVEAIVRRIDGRMSPYRLDSELARFNDGGGQGIALSAETRGVVVAALDLARASDGAFDPTSAPLGRRFGFGSTRISATRPAGHFRDLSLVGQELQSVRPGLSLDLCAIAKGYALDEMVAGLEGLDFLIELGGEIAARGRHPSGRPWRLGIERPGRHALQRIIEADGRALATSGDAVQGYTIGGQRYGHVVDPRSGVPVANGVASVSVLAPTGQLADGLATAAMVLGPGAARDLLAGYDASALFLMRRSPGLEKGPKEALEEVDVLGFVRNNPA